MIVILQSIVAHSKIFFYKHLLQLYLNDLICTKIPKPLTVELGDSELFFFITKLFIIARIMNDLAVFVWSKLTFWPLEKSSLFYRSSLSYRMSLSNSSLYPSYFVLRISLANKYKKGRKKWDI